MQIDALMADRYLACNLLGSPLKPKEERHNGPDRWVKPAGITAASGSHRRLGAGLFSGIATTPTPTIEFAADGAAVSAQQSGNLADGLFGFQKAVNLVSFFSAEVLVHLATWTWRFEWP
jgi:hypothetical protein